MFRVFGSFSIPSQFALNFMLFVFVFLPLHHDTVVWFSSAMLKTFKFYFLLILITCPLPHSA